MQVKLQGATARTRNALLCWCTCLLSASAGAVPPSSQPRDTFSVEAGGPAAAVAIQCQGQALFRLRGEGAERRAAQVLARLRQAFFSAESLPPVVSVTREGFPRLLVAGARVLTVGRTDAKRNQTTPSALAALWAGNLRQAFSRWERRPFPQRLYVPVGGTLSWKVSRLVSSASADNSDSQVATVTATDQTLLFTGRQSGRTKVSFRLPDAVVTTQVVVLPPAGRTLGTAQVLFSSRELPATLRRLALQAAAWSVLQPLPGTTVSVRPVDSPSGSSARLTATSPSALDFATEIPVRVRYRPLLVQPCRQLLVSNNPERVSRSGALLSHAISGATRLLYHHLNVAPRPLTLVVELVNTGESPREVGVVLAAAGPAIDEMHVGHLAARTFLWRRSRGEGFTFALPPGGCVPVVLTGFRPGGTVSGLVELLPDTPADGLRLRIRAAETPVATVADDQSSTDTPGVAFPTPDIRATVSYRVGGPWTFFTIGRKGIRTRSGSRELAGNYGVLYDLALRLENPADQPQPVKLLFAPAGGVARGTFIIAGRHLEAPLTRSGSESLLTVLTLRPRSTRTLRLITMPESASNYPVRLVVRTD